MITLAFLFVVAVLVLAMLVTRDMGPLLIAGFILHYWQDRRLAASVSLPAWYLPLRLRLTVVACLALAAVSFASYC